MISPIRSTVQPMSCADAPGARGLHPPLPAGGIGGGPRDPARHVLRIAGLHKHGGLLTQVVQMADGRADHQGGRSSPPR
jgi:hypothetical protein